MRGGSTWLLAGAWLLGACAGPPEDDGHGHAHGADGAHGPPADDFGELAGHDHATTWNATAWGEYFEVYMELDPVAAGASALAHVHLTRLADFAPVAEADVRIVSYGSEGEGTFVEPGLRVAGLYDLELTGLAVGEHELFLRVEEGERSDDVPLGTLVVAADAESGELIAPRQPYTGGEVANFTKEQQWNTPFATDWATRGSLPLVARGPGRVRPTAGGEVVLAAPVGGVVTGRPWPHVGASTSAGAALFDLMPAVAAGQSLAMLRAIETERRAAMRVAEERLRRLEGLPAQATSPAEIEAARAEATSLRAQYEAAQSDRRTAEAGRAGGATGESVPVISPLAGKVAAVNVQPGQVVSAGEAIARVVQVEPYWVEVHLRPLQAAALAEGSAGLSLRGGGMGEPLVLSAERVRLVARSPEVSAETGTIACTFEVQGVSPLLGSRILAEVTLPETRTGVLIPESSIVDDAGIFVVYAQYDGEQFVRREVEVLARFASTVVVTGVEAGDRIVTTGGPAIRRATLASTGVGHGHVH